jgi:hypothetical protein
MQAMYVLLSLEGIFLSIAKLISFFLWKFKEIWTNCFSFAGPPSNPK